MQHLDDMELVREFVTAHSEAAFEILVARHVDLVYSAALRQTRDPVLAGEIAQATFIVMVRKAPGFRSGTVVPVWLLRTARYAILAEFRARRRRQQHEREAVMELESQPTEEPGPDWGSLSPMLDEALADLGEKDRAAVVLRYFKQEPFEEVGRILGMNPAAARQRVGRALDKLRRLFARRGIVLSATVLGSALTANAVHAAPANLPVSITAAVAAKAGAIAGSTSIIMNGALKMMAWAQIKTAAVAGVAAILAIGGAALLLEASSGRAQNGAAGLSYTMEGMITYQPIFDSNSPPVLPSTNGMPPEFAAMIESQRALALAQWTNTEPLHARFVVRANDRGWNITIYPIERGDVLLGADSGHSIDSFTDSYDGTNILASREPVPGSTLAHQTSIEPWPVPMEADATSLMDSVWLACASAGYFSSISNGLAMAFDTMRINGMQLSPALTPCRFVLPTTSPALPDEVDYLTTNRTSLASNGGILSFGSENAFTNFFFRCDSRTNIGNLSFPLTFEFCQIKLRNNAKTPDDLRLFSQTTGVITNVIVGPWTWKDPRRDLFVMSDYRLADPSAGYKLSAPIIPPTDDPDVAAAEESRTRMLRNSGIMFRARNGLTN